jgi:hypothetical protein
MKLVKSLLLGSVAGLAAVAGAQAADLPDRRAAPVAVDYVRVCSTYGAGFFYIPGSSDTCLRIGGRVRFDARYVEPFDRTDDAIELFARGRIQVDARTATAYGLLRTFVRFEMSQLGADAVGPNLAQGFIQFGGLTAGKVTSFFSNADLPTQHFGTLRFDDAPDVTLLGYTFQFGGGISATLAIEEGQFRRNNNFLTAGGGLTGGLVFEDPATGAFLFQSPYGVVYGGQTVPDIVANIRSAGTWGSIQLSGAVHQIRDVGIPGGRVNAAVVDPVTGLPVALPAFADTEYGWAVGLSGHLAMPWLGQGDAIWAFGTYSSGAASYSGFAGDIGFGRFAGGGLGSNDNTGVVDALVSPFTGDLEKTDIWNIAAGFTHYWTPQFRTNVFGSYARVEYGGIASFVSPITFTTTAGDIVTLAGATTGFADFNEWRIGANTIWSPVSGLNLGVEVIYAEADYKGRVVENRGSALARNLRLAGDVGAIEGRIRVQRDF